MVDPSAPRVPRLLAVGLAILVVVTVAGHEMPDSPPVGEAAPDGADPAAASPTGARATHDRPATPRGPRTAAATATRPATSASEADRARRYRYTVREGANETTVHVLDSGRPGTTVVVVGGQHGNEPAGSLAAAEVAGWEVERGVLVVVPRANPPALRAGTRETDGRDLNAQFPVGEPPTSAGAKAIWGVVERHDADVVIDLHSSRGIYGVDGGVGQAVFPTVTGDAVDHADTAIERVNRRYDLQGTRSFRRGNVLGRTGQSLTRKVAGDLNETAYIVETTKRHTDRRTRVAWTTAVVRELLELHGLVSGDRPGSR